MSSPSPSPSPSVIEEINKDIKELEAKAIRLAHQFDEATGEADKAAYDAQREHAAHSIEQLREIELLAQMSGATGSLKEAYEGQLQRLREGRARGRNKEMEHIRAARSSGKPSVLHEVEQALEALKAKEGLVLNHLDAAKGRRQRAAYERQLQSMQQKGEELRTKVSKMRYILENGAASEYPFKQADKEIAALAAQASLLSTRIDEAKGAQAAYEEQLKETNRTKERWLALRNKWDTQFIASSQRSGVSAAQRSAEELISLARPGMANGVPAEWLARLAGYSLFRFAVEQQSVQLVADAMKSWENRLKSATRGFLANKNIFIGQLLPDSDTMYFAREEMAPRVLKRLDEGEAEGYILVNSLNSTERRTSRLCPFELYNAHAPVPTPTSSPSPSDYSSDRDRFWALMPHYAVDLSHHARPLRPADVSSVITQVTQALSYLHAKGLAHMDVKPSNILLDTQGGCWLADFGSVGSIRAHWRLSTPAYVPHQYRRCEGESYPARAAHDWWMLGMTVHHLLTDPSEPMDDWGAETVLDTLEAIGTAQSGALKERLESLPAPGPRLIFPGMKIVSVRGRRNEK